MFKDFKLEIDGEIFKNSWEEIEKKHVNMIGGEYQPHLCKPLQRVAIVIPYRNRDNHLKIFTNHLHKVLRKQNIHYKIFVINQQHPNLFNRGALMDVGYFEAVTDFAADCVIFHDVDMLPEDGRHIYNCLQSPRHMGAHVDKFNYIQLCNDFYIISNKFKKFKFIFVSDDNVGGILAMNVKDFEKVNGFHILFYGWGDEDMDMIHR